MRTMPETQYDLLAEPEESTPVEQAVEQGDWIAPASKKAAEEPCDCCANRHLGVYRTDCLRCFARSMSRGVSRLERARRTELEKTWDAERMYVLRTFIKEERTADQSIPHYSSREGNA
jgi:hypothetical protein